jgi:hypothetical protein
MGYISKYDTRFITFINRKYSSDFKYFDDYVIWLFYKKCNNNTENYYTRLEKDIWEYSNFQTGSPRERGRKLNETTHERTRQEKNS